MIELSTLNIGDTIYKVESTINAFTRRKMVLVDENGVEWYRYTKPSLTFSIESYTYVGRADVVVTGKIIPEDVEETKYFIEHEKEGMFYLHDRDVEDNVWFVSKDEAEHELTLRQEENGHNDCS